MPRDRCQACNIGVLTKSKHCTYPPCSSAIPTVFKGVWWDDGWEFDGPGIVYSPWPCYVNGGNSGVIESAVEDMCIGYSISETFLDKWHESDIREFKWRRWDENKFAEKTDAVHITITVRWKLEPNDELEFEFVSIEKQWVAKP